MCKKQIIPEIDTTTSFIIRIVIQYLLGLNVFF